MSVTTASAVRARYGRARRTSTPSRRRVCRHDQSSTLAPRSSVRCVPNCQTFKKLRLSAGRADVRSSRYDLLEEAVLVDLSEDRARVEELRLRPTCGDPPVVEHDDLVRERDGR